MRTLGVWLVVLALGSFLLPRLGMQFVVLVWIYRWGPGVAAGIQIAIGVIGLALIALGAVRARRAPGS